MGKKAFRGPSMPAYNQGAARADQVWAADQARKYGNVGVNSALGGYSWATNPDGTQRVDVNLSSADQMRNNAVNNALNNLNMDPSAAQNTAYNMMTRNLNRDFNNQTTSLSNDLINKGVPVGSQAYNDAMARLTDSHNNTLANASDAAMFKGQDYLTGQINQIGALGSQINNPLNQMVSGTGGNFGGNYDKSFESDMMRYKQKMARRNGITGALGSLAGAGVGAAFGV